MPEAVYKEERQYTKSFHSTWIKEKEKKKRTITGCL